MSLPDPGGGEGQQELLQEAAGRGEDPGPHRALPQDEGQGLLCSLQTRGDHRRHDGLPATGRERGHRRLLHVPAQGVHGRGEEEEEGDGEDGLVPPIYDALLFCSPTPCIVLAKSLKKVLEVEAEEAQPSAPCILNITLPTTVAETNSRDKPS